MYLFINNLEKNQLVIGLSKSEDIFWLQQKISYKNNGKILSNLDKFLKKHKKDIKDFKGILVVNGPGSFAGIRVALSVVNTLGWLLNIPVLGIPLDKRLDNYKLFKKGLKKLKNKKRFRPAQPFYGKEPRITYSSKE